GGAVGAARAWGWRSRASWRRRSAAASSSSARWAAAAASSLFYPRTNPLRGSAGVGGAAGAALFDAVDDGAAASFEALLDAAESLVDPAPAGADQVDEEREVVDPAVPLGEQVALEPLEPPNRLRHQAANLGEVPADREDLLAEALLDGVFDPVRERGLDPRRRLGERLDPRACPP